MFRFRASPFNILEHYSLLQQPWMVIFFWLWISEILANIFKVFQFPRSDKIFPICPAKYSAKLRTSFQLSADRHNNTHIGLILDLHLQWWPFCMLVLVWFVTAQLNGLVFFCRLKTIFQPLIAHQRGYDSHFLSFPSWSKSNKDMIHVFISQNVIFPGRWRIFKQLSQLLVLLFQRDGSSSYFNLKYERQRFPF